MTSSLVDVGGDLSQCSVASWEDSGGGGNKLIALSSIEIANSAVVR